MTRGVAPLPELVAHAERSGTPLVLAPDRSSATINDIHAVLDRLLAPRADVHGVMVEIHGVGTLLLGPSGIGKSECALFLVERGHRLVADDLVQLTRLPNSDVRGAPSPLLKHHLEIRGVGILNIRDLFGATAVCDEARVDLVVELCTFREGEPYERLGLDDQAVDLLGTSIAKLRIPVRPGRDMGVLLEISARNHLLKREGRARRAPFRGAPLTRTFWHGALTPAARKSACPGTVCAGTEDLPVYFSDSGMLGEWTGSSSSS